MSVFSRQIYLPFKALYSAWAAGELSLTYFQTFLRNSFKKVMEAEQNLSRPPWKAVWDRLVPFEYLHYPASYKPYMYYCTH